MAMLQLIRDIDRHGRDNPANTAICGKARIVTYQSLRDAIVNISGMFAARGVPRGAKVYVNSADDDLWTVAVLACLHFGLIPFCIWHPDNNAGEVDYDLIVASPQMIDDDLPGDIVIDDRVFEPARQPLDQFACTDRQADDLLAVGVTSGTTGRPKLLSWTLEQFTRRMKARRRISDGFRLVDTFGVNSSSGLSMMAAYFSRGVNVVRGDRDPLTTLRLINLFKVDKLKTSPKSISALMDVMERTGIKCPFVSRIDFVGSLLPRAVLERAERHFPAEICNAYGISEIGTLSRGPVTSDTYRLGMAGQVWTELDFFTRRDEESGKDQFVVRNDPTFITGTYENGRAVPQAGELYPLPDFGRIEDGTVYIEGRIDEVYNLSGTKFAYSALIAFLTEIEGIDDAALIRDPEDADPFGLNIAIAHTGHAVHDDILEKLSERLNRRSARDHIRLRSVGEIPRNRAGKIDRERLLALFK